MPVLEDFAFQSQTSLKSSGYSLGHLSYRKAYTIDLNFTAGNVAWHSYVVMCSLLVAHVCAGK